MADDGLRGRPYDVGFLQLLSAGDGDHGQFRGKTFHMLSLPVHEALRDQQREINVLMARGFKAAVEFALEQLPYGIAVGFDDHAAFDDLGRFGHIAL
jgi:hypothetical protein